MAPRFTFEQALKVLEIDATAGPRGAKRGYMLQLQRHGPEPSPQDHARFTAAYEVLKDPAAWPDYEEPEVWDDDLMPTSRSTLPPGHQRSERERPRPAPRPTTMDAMPPRAPQRPREAQAENPFDVATEPAPAAEEATLPADVGALLGHEDIAEALSRLDGNFGTSIDKATFAEHLANPRIDGTVALLNELLAQGNLLALGGALTTVLDLMTSDMSRTFLSSREVARLLAEIFGLAGRDAKARAVGASVQRAHDRWATASEATGTALDIGTKDLLRTTRSLAALPEEFPQVLTAAIARSAQRGDASSARPEFSSWIQEYPEQADGLRRMMARSAPSLLPPLLDLFPDREAQQALDAVSHKGPSKKMIRALIVLVILAVGASLALSDGLFDSKAAAQAREARKAICDLSGASHSACVWASVITRAAADEDCDVIQPAIPKLLDALGMLTGASGGMSVAVDLGALNDMKAKADGLVVTAQKMCPGT